ncbi:MAG: hypothetical protein KGR26_15590 [Cyanobacteria bacterium REEB65]|nr:hypothetical protein [Cyanobacteria bacterium REEB65]
MSPSKAKIFLYACAIGLIGAPTSRATQLRPDAAQDFSLTPAEQATIAQGGITVRHRSIAGTSLNEFFSAGYVDAPVDQVLAFYEDYRNTPKFQDSIRKIERIGVWPDYQQIEYWIDLPFPIGRRNFVLDVSGEGIPGQRGAIWWRLEHGDIREMRGSYLTTAAGPDRTLVKYHLVADMNTWLPAWLVGFVQGGTIPNVIGAARRDLGH